ncbi:hypothetical protein [Vibrio salinus]|uniref:hypothetical protein n=1 Tax=Vibrio salinus TaxID=2899784 RepID=UPI001E5A4139|nr:hypothetical protein [Vibrio salinus]MCE0495773.1 hypothetical protein [Vibrio salinus]
MDMVSVNQFLPELRTMIPNIMNEIMKREVVKAARRFCEDTNIFIITETVSSESDVQTFDIPSLWAASGNRQDKMEFANVVLVTGDEETLYESSDYTMPDKGSIAIEKAYRSISIMASVKPERAVNELPESLYNQYAEFICYGAASKLYTVAGHENGDLHQYYEREYIEGMRKVKRWRLNSFPHQPFSPRKRNRSFF